MGYRYQWATGAAIVVWDTQANRLVRLMAGPVTITPQDLAHNGTYALYPTARNAQGNWRHVRAWQGARPWTPPHYTARTTDVP
jgi:hypothetical protein